MTQPFSIIGPISRFSEKCKVVQVRQYFALAFCYLKLQSFVFCILWKSLLESWSSFLNNGSWACVWGWARIFAVGICLRLISEMRLVWSKGVLMNTRKVFLLWSHCQQKDKGAKSTPWAENSNFLLISVNNLFKFSAQGSDLAPFFLAMGPKSKYLLDFSFLKVHFKVRFELLDDNLYCKSFHRKLRSDAVSGWAVWALVHPEFESSVNPIPTRGRGKIMPTKLLSGCPPGFENLTASL